MLDFLMAVGVLHGIQLRSRCSCSPIKSRNFFFKPVELKLFLFESDRLFFILKLDCVQVHNQACVLLRFLFDVGFDPLLVFDGVAFMLSDTALHVPELSVELFNNFGVPLFILARVS